jgi:hypothetical protein
MSTTHDPLSPVDPLNQAPAVQNLNLVEDTPSLPELIDRWKAEGITLELIIALIMSNPYGEGAMDMVSNSIAGITKQSDILSQVQSDVITLNSILSKIESQLGVKTVGQSTWSKFPKSLLTQFQQTYKNLFVGNANNPNGESDLDALKGFEQEFPDLAATVAGVSSWQTDNFKVPLPNGNNFDIDIQNWNPKNTSLGSDPFINDVVFLGENHYAANNSSDGGSKVTDYLQNWWSAGDTSQQLCSGQSQANTTKVQAYMQLLQGFNNSGQQMLQGMGEEKIKIIQNQRAS